MAEMERIHYFIPGDQALEEGWVSRLRRPIPSGVAQAYVEAYTGPGESVLLPFCQGPTEVRETLAAGRQVLALNFDPLLILLVRVALDPPPARELNAAVARLGDSLKQGVPLRRYLERLYLSTCPACQRQAAVDYFVWDREQGVPVAKYLRCPACTWNGQTAVGPEDRQRLDEIPARGMQYHYVLDRVLPSSHGQMFRSRLEYLLELYSPRGLYALAEITLKIESLFPGGAINQVLKVLLLDCLDRCSLLAALPGSMARQRGLARPGRYLERNVWYAFEEAAVRFQAWVGAPMPGLADTWESLHAPGTAWAGFVGQALVRDLPRRVQPRSLRLILVSPPSLDSAVWSLSYFWGAWLLGAGAVAPLLPLLRQRTPDHTWYARVMTGSFSNLVDLLRDDGRLVLILTGQRPALVEALMLAASEARLGVAVFVQSEAAGQREASYRVELTPTLAQSSPVSGGALDGQIRRAAVEAAAEAIQVRGEPVSWPVLHAAVVQRLTEENLLSRALAEDTGGLHALDFVAGQVSAGLDNPTLVCLPNSERDQEFWWLARPPDVAQPLCDRIEEAAYEVLHEALVLTESGFSRAMYARFPGPLTPDSALVAACLRAYGRESSPGYWQLRTEDLPDRRRMERETMLEHLVTLGRKLGYRAVAGDPYDVEWWLGDQARAVFVVRWKAAVRDLMALGERARGTNPHLVIPGGRAELVSYKLAHNPVWQQAADRAAWRFIKYRHVRQLAAQDEVDEYTLRTMVGLDPIVEQEGAQIPLF
jgi:hypothetical protein